MRCERGKDFLGVVGVGESNHRLVWGVCRRVIGAGGVYIQCDVYAPRARTTKVGDN